MRIIEDDSAVTLIEQLKKPHCRLDEEHLFRLQVHVWNRLLTLSLPAESKGVYRECLQ